MRITLLLFLSLLIIPAATDAQYSWKKSGGINGGFSRTIYAKGDTLLAGAGNAIYYSTNRGEDWNRSVNNDFTWECEQIVHTDSTVFFAIVNHGLYISPNMSHWYLVHQDPSYCALVRDKYGVIYLANGSKVRYSRNNGKTFSSLFNTDDTEPNIFTSDKNVFVTGKNCIYRKSITDNSAWKRIPMDIFSNSIELTGDSSGRIIAMGWHNPILLTTTDEGDNWTQIDLRGKIPDASPVQIAFHGKKIVIENRTDSESDLFYSQDMGETWHSSLNFPKYLAVIKFISYGDDFLASTYGGAIWISHDHGRNWKSYSKNINEAYMYNLLAADDCTLYATTYFAGFHKSTNKGKTWFEIKNELISSYSSVMQKNSCGKIYIAGRYGLLYTIDGGKNWNQVKGHSGNFIVNNDILYVIGGNYIYSTTDDGENWNIFYNHGLGDPSNLSFGSNGDAYITLRHGSSIIKTSDNGKTWIPVFYYSRFEKPLVTDKGSVLVPTLGFFKNLPSGLARSADNGKTWEVQTKFYNSNIEDVFNDKKGNVWASSFWNYINPTLYRSTDEGENWVIENKNLILTTVKDMAFMGDDIFLATEHGLWRNESIISSSEEYLPQKFFVGQNYPNPFNPSTTIEYFLPSTERVRIKIFDLLGKEVCILKDEEETSGSHKVEFKAVSYPSGVYFFQIIAGDQIETRKMLLVK